VPVCCTGYITGHPRMIKKTEVLQVRDLLHLLLTETRKAQRDMGPHISATRLDNLAMQVETILERAEKMLR
jgi:hypothetical protein